MESGLDTVVVFLIVKCIIFGFKFSTSLPFASALPLMFSGFLGNKSSRPGLEDERFDV